MAGEESVGQVFGKGLRRSASTIARHLGPDDLGTGVRSLIAGVDDQVRAHSGAA
jgi:hypothetical protein